MGMLTKSVGSHRLGRSRSAVRCAVRGGVALVAAGMLVSSCATDRSDTLSSLPASSDAAETTVAVAGAQENAVGDAVGASWNLGFYKSGYDRVESGTLDDGTTISRLVADKRHYMRAVVPTEQRASGSNAVVLQYQDAEGNWVSLPDRYVYNYDGTVEGWFTAPKTVGASKMRLVTTNSVFSSEEVTVLQLVQYDIRYHNRMKDDIKIRIPTNYNTEKQEFDEAELDIPAGKTLTLRYINPVQGAGFGFRAKKKGCLVNCWNTMHPEQNDENLSYNCANQQPKFFSGETYDVNLDNAGAWDFTFALGSITGKFEADASISKSCVFAMRTGLSNVLYKGGVWSKIGEVVIVFFALAAILWFALPAAVAVETATVVTGASSDLITTSFITTGSQATGAFIGGAEAATAGATVIATGVLPAAEAAVVYGAWALIGSFAVFGLIMTIVQYS